ncbi:MAG TPA: amidase [Thermoanaerobaculia bacterium]|jgi:amidase|nr:amidase [Thermoanaerobaculia bacterium]
MDKQDDDAIAGAWTRRSLIKASLAGGALAAAMPLLAQPRSSPPSSSAPPPFELEEATIGDLRAALKSGKETARSITEKYLARIGALNAQGPELRAVIETNPEALAIADALDAERRAKGPRGPLHGVPILLKDNIGTADRMTTTAGSLALEGLIPSRDAFVAARLREAGAILLGKANLSEWANFRSSRSTSGWSSRGGQCRNPYALDRDPSGSSSGSAAGVAANLCAAAVGSETDGSIVSPSSICGIVGIKPTVGLLSRTGVVPISHTQDTAGPMARTVTDAAILLGAMTGVDERDKATLPSRGKALADYSKFLDPKGLAGARIGVYHPSSLDKNPWLAPILAEALAAMKEAGATIVDPVKIPSVDNSGGTEYQVLLYDFKADLNQYLAELGPQAPVHSLKEAIEFNERHRNRVMPYFGQEIFLEAEAKGPLTDPKYKKALAVCRRAYRTEGLDAILARHKLDAIVALTGGPAWLIDLVNGDTETGGSSSLAAVSGYPSLTVPAGFTFGLPIGLSFIGPAWSEGALIRLAYAFETATKARKAPRFLATADLAVR